MSTIDQAKVRESPPAKDRRPNHWATVPTIVCSTKHRKCIHVIVLHFSLSLVVADIAVRGEAQQRPPWVWFLDKRRRRRSSRSRQNMSRGWRVTCATDWTASRRPASQRRLSVRCSHVCQRCCSYHQVGATMCSYLCALLANKSTAIRAIGPTAVSHIWNSLPLHVTSAPSLQTFKKRLKPFLFSCSFPS